MVIEDEPRIIEILKSALFEARFVADFVRLCVDGRLALTSHPYDAAVLDLGLPDGDGLGLLSEIRAAGSPIPVLVLTARDTVEDRVCRLNRGADDYLVKPFAISELIALTKALLRRPGGALGTILKAETIDLETLGRDVCVGATTIHLARRECAILEHLMRRLGRVVRRPFSKTSSMDLMMSSARMLSPCTCTISGAS